MSDIEDLKNALRSNIKILNVKDCPQVSVVVGQAMYGRIQNDGKGQTLNKDSDAGVMARLLGFGGAPEDTALWHFCTGPAVHHFVVIPAKNAERQWRFIMLMAYEESVLGANDGYSLRKYVNSTCGLSAGYQESRTSSELVVMLRDLLNDKATWGKYFLNGVEKDVNEIICYKYEGISVKRALQNLAKL